MREERMTLFLLWGEGAGIQNTAILMNILYTGKKQGSLNVLCLSVVRMSQHFATLLAPFFFPCASGNVKFQKKHSKIVALKAGDVAEWRMYKFLPRSVRLWVPPPELYK
jgi:hypothetical protein